MRGAIVIGAGLASVMPAYQETTDALKAQGKWPRSKAKLLAIGCLVLALLMGFVLASWHFSYFVIELLVLLIGAAVFAWHIPSPTTATTAFAGPVSLRPALATILIFLMTLGARGLKQTGARQLIWLTLALWVVMVFGFGAFHRRVKTAHLWIYVTGAIVNFYLIYGLFYFSALNAHGLLFLSYALFILGTIGGQLALKPFRQHQWLVTIGLLAASLVITVIPNRWCFLAGMFLTSCFCSVINATVWPAFQRDPKSAGHARFVRQRYNILGSIISQVSLVSLLIITNWLFDDHARQLLAAYYDHQAVHGLNYPLWLTRLGCVVLLLVTLLVATIKQHRELVNR